MTLPTLEQLSTKLNELILAHNALAKAVIDVSEAIVIINETVLSQGDVPDRNKFDS
jgi:hypothetical protein